MVRAAGDKCEVQVKTKIVSLTTEREDGKVEAVTEDGQRIIASKAVIAAGPWTNSLLKSSKMPALNLDIWQVQWAHYEVDTEIADSIPQAFHFRKEPNIDGGLYYVFPASATESISGTEGKSVVKVGVDFPTGSSLSDMSSFGYNGSEEVLNLTDEWVNEHLPGVGSWIDSQCHPYTMTSGSFFVMDTITPNITVFSGGTGRAFKFGPLLGDCMAAFLSGDGVPVDLVPFSLNRSELQLN